MPEDFAFSAATSDDLRRRRRLVFWLAHSLVNTSKTSGDSYRTEFFPSGKGPTRPRKIGIPRSSKSVLQSSIPIWSCNSLMASKDSKSFSRIEPSDARVMTRMIRWVEDMKCTYGIRTAWGAELIPVTLRHRVNLWLTRKTKFSVPTPIRDL